MQMWPRCQRCGRGGEGAGWTLGGVPPPPPRRLSPAPSLALCSGGWWSCPLSGTFWLSWANRPHTLLAPSPTATFSPKLLKQLSSQLEEISRNRPVAGRPGAGVSPTQSRLMLLFLATETALEALAAADWRSQRVLAGKSRAELPFSPRPSPTCAFYFPRAAEHSTALTWKT